MRVAGRDGVLELEPAAVVATCAPLVPSLMVMAVADRFPTRTLGPAETLDGVACRRVDLEDRDGLPGAAWFVRTWASNVLLTSANWKFGLFGMALVLMMIFRPQGILPPRAVHEDPPADGEGAGA